MEETRKVRKSGHSLVVTVPSLMREWLWGRREPKSIVVTQSRTGLCLFGPNSLPSRRFNVANHGLLAVWRLGETHVLTLAPRWRDALGVRQGDYVRYTLRGTILSIQKVGVSG